jgi:hypothetical protein
LERVALLALGGDRRGGVDDVLPGGVEAERHGLGQR